MKVLFIIPPYLSREQYLNPKPNIRAKGGLGWLSKDVPLGVLSLHAFCKELLDEVAVVNFNILESFDYENHLSCVKFAPDIVCVSQMFSQPQRNAIDCAMMCKKIWPNAITVVGGHAPTADPAFFETSFDHVVIGEGEEHLYKLMSGKSKFLESLDDIQPLDFGIAEGSMENCSYGDMDTSRSRPIMTSRGCPHRCIFCASHLVHGRSVRANSIQRITRELNRYKDEGVDTVVVQDDHFLFNKTRAVKIIKHAASLGLELVFQNALSVSRLDEEILSALKATSSKQLVIAIETGCPDTMRRIRKPLSLPVAKMVVDICRRLGIYTIGNIIVGFPWETRKSLDASREFLRDLGCNWYSILCATPLPGSELSSMVTYDASQSGFKNAVIYTQDMHPQEIEDYAYDMNIDLNFTNNYDIRHGEYELALRGIRNALKAKPGLKHAIDAMSRANL